MYIRTNEYRAASVEAAPLCKLLEPATSGKISNCAKLPCGVFFANYPTLASKNRPKSIHWKYFVDYTETTSHGCQPNIVSCQNDAARCSLSLSIRETLQSIQHLMQ